MFWRWGLSASAPSSRRGAWLSRERARALEALPALPGLEDARSHDAPLSDAIVRLLRAEQFERLEDFGSARKTLLWYEHLQTVGRGTGDPTPGEMGWALGTLARWRLANLRGVSIRERCSAYRAVARHWSDGMAPFKSRADSARTFVGQHCTQLITCRVLGPIEVIVDGAPAPAELLWRKHLALLVYLGRSPKRARTREHLCGLLWPEKEESAARHSLNEALRVVRKSVGDAGLDTSGGQVRLAADAMHLDADTLEALMAEGAWAAAAAFVAGEFLEGFAVPGAEGFEDWLASERRHWTGRSVVAFSGGAKSCSGRATLRPRSTQRGARKRSIPFRTRRHAE